MPWTPAEEVINARAIAENLLAYFEANQADALTWANGTAMKSFQRIENSIGNRNAPVYPAIMFNDDSDATDYTETLPIGAYSATFLVLIQNSDPGAVVVQARKYAVAIASMIRNCPPSTYTANTGVRANAAVLETIEMGFDPVKTNDTQNDFLQEFSIKVTYTLHATA